jgi:hypothetical protein
MSLRPDVDVAAVDAKVEIELVIIVIEFKPYKDMKSIEPAVNRPFVLCTIELVP